MREAQCTYQILKEGDELAPVFGEGELPTRFFELEKPEGFDFVDFCTKTVRDAIPSKELFARMPCKEMIEEPEVVAYHRRKWDRDDDYVAPKAVPKSNFFGNAPSSVSSHVPMPLPAQDN